MEFEGLEITAYRSSLDGRLVVEIATGELAAKDTHAEGDTPNIVVYINEQRIEISSCGELIEN